MRSVPHVGHSLTLHTFPPLPCQVDATQHVYAELVGLMLIREIQYVVCWGFVVFDVVRLGYFLMSIATTHTSLIKYFGVFDVLLWGGGSVAQIQLLYSIAVVDTFGASWGEGMGQLGGSMKCCGGWSL